MGPQVTPLMADGVLIEAGKQIEDNSIPVVLPDTQIAAIGSPSGAVPSGSPDSGNPVKVGWVAYNPDSLPAPTAAGNRINAVADLQGRLDVYLGTTLDSVNDAIRADPATGTPVSSVAYEASHVLKASPGKLISVSGFNSGPAQWIQIYNSITVPADAAVPVATYKVPATSNFAFEWPITGLPCSAGISVSNSSTGPTKTIGAADVFYTGVVI